MSTSLLADAFRKIVKSHKDLSMKMEKEADVGYSTGYPNFDFRNASVIHVKNDNMNLDYKYYSVGITDGAMVGVIGGTGTGKTTFVNQVAANIIRPFKSACVFEDALESGLQDSRKERLTGFTGDQLKERWITRNVGITSESFFERMKIIHDLRMQQVNEYMYDTGYKNYNGNPIYKMEPCCYILDSWALLRPKGLVEEEQISGQMSVTSSAKMNTEIIRRIIPMLKEANIILFIVNHILSDVNINPYAKKRKQVQYLEEGERVPGGDSVLYLANTLLRLDVSTLKPELFGIDGTIVRMKILKSRTNKPNTIIQLVYDYRNGYDPELSLYLMMKLEGKIESSGAWMHIVGYPDMKFQQKGFKNKLREDSKFQQVFMEECIKVLKSMCDEDIEAEKEEAENNSLFVTDMMNSIVKKSAA